MRLKGLLATRLGAAALLAIVAATAFAQDQGGQGGPPPGGMMGGPGGGMRGGPPAADRLPVMAQLASRPEVVAELGLSDDQVSQIRAIAEASRPQRGQGGQGGGRPDPATREKAEAAADQQVKAVLTDAQAKRLAQIQIQAMGLTAALVPSVQTKLGLTDDQKTQLKALVPPRRQGGPGGMGGPGGDGGQGGPPPDMQGQGGGQGGPPDMQGGQGGPGGGMGGPGGGGMGGGMQAQRKALETKIAAILTTDQKASLKALGGKTIKLSEGRGPGGMGGPGQGGPGGPGGQGGPPPDGF